nr:MAG TPA_asm: hypothetical protein [Caudoviricetes sp.]
MSNSTRLTLRIILVTCRRHPADGILITKKALQPKL